MAAKKEAPTKGTAVAVRKTTSVGAVGDWRQEMQKYTKKAEAMEGGGGGQSLKVDKAGRLTLAGSPVKNSELTVIVLAQCIEHAYYNGPYDPEKKQIPICFALSEDREGMAPHKDSAEPQSDACDGCEYNEFGSADTGRGKACKQVKRLAVLVMEELTLDAIQHGDIINLTPSVTNVKSWDAYEKHIRKELDSMFFFWRTVISTEADDKTQYKMYFQAADKTPVPEKFRSALIVRVKEAEKLLLTPYSPMPEQEERKPKRSGGGPNARKAAPAKKTSSRKPEKEQEEAAPKGRRSKY